MAWVPQQGPGFEQYGQPGMRPEMMQRQQQQQAPPVGPNNPLNDVFYGASSGLIGTYLGNSRDYVQSNVSAILDTPRVSFQCFIMYDFEL